jgi:tRNA A-37 threonylcarbamoyl transferase component Bud32
MENVETALQQELGEDFEILRPLGEGANAVVYMAREKALRRLVAIKVLKPDVAEDETTRKRFEREGRSMAQISHPNVVSVYRVGTLEDGIPFLVMEYINGRTLKDALEAHGPYGLDRGEEILGEIASALEAAHQTGVIHRDLRPGNVIEEQETGRIVLTDFGLAGIAPSGSTQETRLTMQGQMLGNPTYASPEQLRGDPVTEYTDLYSLGILGYELLTQGFPYDARTNVEFLTAHLQKEPKPLAQLQPNVDKSLAALLERCLSKKPEQRPTAAETREAMRRLKSGAAAGPTTGPHALPAEPQSAADAFFGEMSRRHVWRFGVAYVAVAAVIIGVGEGLPEEFGLAGVHRVVSALLIAGFPLALVLAWLYDITATGIKRTESSESPDSGGAGGKLKAIQITSLSFTLLLSGLILWFLLVRPGS